MGRDMLVIVRIPHAQKDNACHLKSHFHFICAVSISLSAACITIPYALETWEQVTEHTCLGHRTRTNNDDDDTVCFPPGDLIMPIPHPNVLDLGEGEGIVRHVNKQIAGLCGVLVIPNNIEIYIYIYRSPKCLQTSSMETSVEIVL